MFTKAKNIETAFRHVRAFTIVIICGSLLVAGTAVYAYLGSVTKLQNRIYILYEGKVLEATGSNRRDVLLIEAQDHIRTFHELFFRLEPDEKSNSRHLRRALYLIDDSGKEAYKNFKESNYYAGIVSNNINQKLEVDSVQVDLQQQPYHFKCFATQQIERTSSTVTRSLITEGELRKISSSENNPHGFLIQHWKTLENKDISIKNQ
ncbi:conjugative transposon protein TraK [Mucilaginibacter terrae]|uniref:Conjugative transposon TraK protein n=1 Tax=Mucilaginibacter terrae TaxID=1955052 RepID=A0ABU3GRB4_9SPHI|nr:conjugative transposon protein TraK [Mucilaginibacter terrae]MDT3402324.1 conjugative transposon TraK protein [Mucilaginibacter terrae]